MSWILGIFVSLLTSGLRSSTKASKGPEPAPTAQGVNECLALFKGLLAIVQFILDCNINDHYYKDTYQEKDNYYTTANVLASIFGMLDSVSSAVAALRESIFSFLLAPYFLLAARCQTND